jgi:hypothetical protein
MEKRIGWCFQAMTLRKDIDLETVVPVHVEKYGLPMV